MTGQKPNLRQVAGALEQLYPLEFAEDWDHPGLIVGDLNDAVGKIVFAADPTMAVVDKAIAMGADLLVCHHPLFFRAVHEVSGYGVHGAITGKLYRAHCGLWVGHTNADVAYRGVAQAAADAFGLRKQQPLVTTGQDDGRPVGLGRVGTLKEPMTLRAFAQRVADEVPKTKYGIQVAGDLDAEVQRIAVLPGSGDSNFNDVRISGADVYVTSDLRHHPATDALQQAWYEAALNHTTMKPALINTPHSAIESMWFRYALDDVADIVEKTTGFRPETKRIGIVTDPWQLVLGRDEFTLVNENMASDN
ncbi:Nif3-like dinuclear metal center hexameric protein [Bifidobacterium sp. ESL0745]|uniref:Nif3-like dinuclear metal center hexameric protein n=1 Tax=Bifidobacterium sp. ESL0745 TaxID=2983226 RepID=UPI0023F97D3D|nr:Nif3-like dinuclear metal center hexameric protein [Bifidobacterium sp. ESL0745]MDF7665200.1 Nif3-like dinuclear metal center hexameric protein [Bifidobacterium sp. ESL0745]